MQRGWFRWNLAPGVLALGPMLLIAALATVPVFTTATASPPASFSDRSGLGGTRSIASVPGGASSYVGGVNGNARAFQIPLVRTDSPQYGGSSPAPYDTIIHVSNATASSTQATVTFYNPDGTTKASVPQTIGTWATWDVDAVGVVGTGWFGSAEVDGSGLAVAADIISGGNGGGAGNDNLDSYAGLTSPLTTGYVAFAFTVGGYTSSIYVRNPGGNPANVSLTYFAPQGPNQPGISVGTASFAVPARGVGCVSTSSMSSCATKITLNNYTGPVQLTSDQPVAGVVEEAGVGGSYAMGPVLNAASIGSLPVPNFQYDQNTSNWNSDVVVLNAGQSNASFTATFYNPDGSQKCSLNSGMANDYVNGVPPMRSWVVGILQVQLANSATNPGSAPCGLPNGWYGSVVVSSTGGAASGIAVVLRSQYQLNSLNLNLLGAAAFPAVAAPPGGTWGYLPAIRKGSGGETTAFTMMNTQGTPQDYQVDFWNQAGQQVAIESLSLGPNQAWYFDQATDPNVPAGFNGSAQIVNTTVQSQNGPVPYAVVDLYAGPFAVPPPSGVASPTPFPPRPAPTFVPCNSKCVYIPYVADGSAG